MHQERARVKALEKQRAHEEGSVKSKKLLGQKSDTEDLDKSDDGSVLTKTPMNINISRPNSRPHSRMRPESRDIRPSPINRPISGASVDRPVSKNVMNRSFQLPDFENDEVYEYQVLNLKQGNKIKELKIKNENLKVDLLNVLKNSKLIV